MAEEGAGKRFSLLMHAAGLIVIYSLYGILQEKIMKSSTYGPNDEHFTSSSLLIVFNRLFSISTALALLYFQSRHASVAAFNFLSTTCQYQALRYVSYTTQSLAKTSKMVPVLVVGAVVWKKTHATREWVAGGVILAGCATYLFSSPPIPHGSHAAAATAAVDDSLWDGLVGAAYLLGYLFFDGLVSTTQERVFGRNPSSSDPFGPESPVLDQMAWTNVFALLFAVLASLASTATGSFWSNLELLLLDGRLFFDACVFSAASALGLIVLLNTIASFGALTSSLIMTIRQFLSILVNAGVFGTWSSTSAFGWMGVFWVASGVWIKINKKYDPPKAPQIVFDTTEEGKNPGGKDASSASLLPVVMQYLVPLAVPVAVPVAIAILISPFLDGGAPNLSSLSLSTPSSYEAAPVLDSPRLPIVEPLHVEAEVEEGESAFAVDDNVPPTLAASVEPSEAEDEDVLNDADAAEASELAVAIEGGSWDAQLHKALAPACKDEIEVVPYRSELRTGFVSYPRSGNSYLRSLVERATGYQTSSIYCDRNLAKTFHGECNKALRYFVKSHFPALPRFVSSRDDRWTEFYKNYDQVVHVVRNPLDAVASWYHLRATKTDDGLNHEAKAELPGDRFGDLQREEILDLARRWRRHSVYWEQAPVLTHTLRYEDLKAQPVPNMMALVSFLLPDEDLPPLEDIACIAEHHENLQAYHSRRSSDFAQWDNYEPSLRDEVLDIVRRPFCSFGYHRMLLDVRGDEQAVVDAMAGFCDDVGMQAEFDEAAEHWGPNDT
ncbi:hypothetical protein Rhopal_007132-T1 [Rhodotorula paludigena]|uniref:Sulfotransferase domain-containing protein n=1 Tax=Rhodotorula paludigena TaxID=86838 RepID=A0AAV5GV23_9BASI|nr:hypothetical protein Rhopal_007132-T1 [Rhodotorula paludigena]